MTNDNIFDYKAFDLLHFVRGNIKPLALLTLAGAVVSAVVSLLIEPKFRSTVILFPTTQESVSNALLGENPSKGLLMFGQEEEAEQMLQVLHSDRIMNQVIELHGLMEHYAIDPGSAYPRTSLAREYQSNIKFRRTEFMSVEISVLDKDPQKAAAMANDIARLLDSTMNRMQKERAQMALDIVRAEYDALDHSVQTLSDSLDVLRDLGVSNYYVQAEVYSEALATAIAESAPRGAIDEIQAKLDTVQKYGGAYIRAKDLLYVEKERMAEVAERLAEAKVDAEQNLPSSYVVDAAQVAERKAYPVRWLIVALSTVGTFVVGLFGLLALDAFRRRGDAST